MRILFTFLSFLVYHFVFAQSNLNLTGVNLKDLVIISMPENELLENESNIYIQKKYVYESRINKLYDPIQNKVIGYLPNSAFSNQNHSLHIRKVGFYEIYNYFIYVYDSGIAVYKKDGKLIRTIEKKFTNKQQRLIEFQFSNNFKRICYEYEKDIYIADLNILTGTITNHKQVTFKGIFTVNYNAKIHDFIDNIILADDENGKTHWINVDNGDVKDSELSNGFKNIASDPNEYKIKILDHTNPFLVFFDYYFKNKDENEKGDGYVMYYDIKKNNLVYASKEIGYVSFLFAGKKPNLDYWYEYSKYEGGNRWSYLVNVEGGVEQKRYKFKEDEWYKTYIPYLSPNHDYWARGVNQNLMRSEANSEKNQVLDLNTGEVQEFANKKYKISQILWVNDSIFVFSILDQSIFLLKGPNEFYSSNETGTYFYDVKSKKLKKIFDYGQKDFFNNNFVSSSSSKNTILISVNNNLWEYNINNDQKKKITQQSSQANIEIFSNLF